jgi:hypothetical protein
MNLKDCLGHAIEAHASIHGRSSMTFDEFLTYFGGWKCIPVDVESHPVGALLVNGPEIHACINKGYGRWATKPLVRELERIKQEHGKAVTSVANGNRIGEQFVERLGFAKVRETDAVTYYEVTYGH